MDRSNETEARILGMAQDELVAAVVDICADASRAILDVYHQSGEAIQVDRKADDSPVTQADLAASRIIEAALHQLTPDIPIVCEEIPLPSFEQRKEWRHYWLVDPLDGTKEFIRRNDQFTVNIALIEDGNARLGVVYVPVTGVAYTGIVGSGAAKIVDGERRAIQCRSLPRERLAVVASKHHGNAKTDAIIARLRQDWSELELCSVGSSLKFCLLAEGAADVYPRFAPTCEWDTAAAHAVLEAAGGEVYSVDHMPLRYNQKDEMLNPFFYAVAAPKHCWSGVFD